MSDQFKYNIPAWHKITKQLLEAVKVPLTLAVFTATCVEMPDGTATVVAHCDGYELAMRQMANVLYHTYGDGAYEEELMADQVEAPAVIAAHLN